MKAVKQVAIAVNEPVMIAGMEADPNLLARCEDAEAGQVMLITQAASPTEVEVVLVFPTKDPAYDEAFSTDKELHIKPTAIKFTLNTFLNVARMLALQHGAVIKQPEAVTDDNVPPKIIKPS